MSNNIKVTFLKSKRRSLSMRQKPKRTKRFSFAAVVAIALDVPFLQTRATVNAEARKLERFMIESLAEEKDKKIPLGDYTSIAKQSLLQQFPKLQGINSDHIIDAPSYLKWSEELKKIFGARFGVKKISWEVIYRYPQRQLAGGM